MKVRVKIDINSYETRHYYVYTKKVANEHKIIVFLCDEKGIRKGEPEELSWAEGRQAWVAMGRAVRELVYREFRENA